MDSTPFGHYQLQKLIGRGGMGEVYQAYDSDTDRIVALKVLPPHLAQDSTFQERFRRESHAAAGVSNPHVVPIHGYGEIDGRLYLDMRLGEGTGGVLALHLVDAACRIMAEMATFESAGVSSGTDETKPAGKAQA